MDNIIRKEIIRKKKNSLVSRVWTKDGTYLLNEDYGRRHGERLNHEYFISSSIDLKCILKPLSFESKGDSSVLIYEDIDGELLNNTNTVDNLDHRDRLILALKISDILKDLHSVGIIHNHLSLDNIIYNHVSKKIRITDLTGSRLFLDEHEASDNLNLIESVNPLYISPEQTGKVGKPIDYRTDLYSAGVIFYRIFAGIFPFEDGDILSRHINEKPDVSILQKNISEIISKLLEKDPDARYQSAKALKRDIIFCLRNRSFKDAGLSDIKFKPDYDKIVPTKASAKLINAIRINGRKVLFFLNGMYGSGKSSAVGYLVNKLESENQIYLKIDNCEITQTIPYYSLISSLQPYLFQISEELKVLPEEITALVYGRSEYKAGRIWDRNGLVYHLIKVLEKVFNGRRPVLIIEDCEYMDNASMEIIDAAIKFEKFKDLFVLYTSAKEDLKGATGLNYKYKRDIIFEKMSLDYFTVKETLGYLSKCLFSEREKVTELSLFFQEITNGDPSYIAVLTDYLFKKNLIYYNRHRGNFLWNLNRIKSSNIPENFEKLLFEVIHDFSEELKGYIYSASVFGYRFSSENIKKIMNQNGSMDLSNTGNLFIPLNSDYLDFRFRTRKISLLLKRTISEDFLCITRKSLARVILKKISHKDLFKIFVAVFFLNRAKELIIKDNEVLSHAELNLYCGINLGNIFRYNEALLYFSESCFKTDDILKNDEELLKKIYRNIMKTSYLTCDFSNMENYSELMKRIESDFVLNISEFSDQSKMVSENPGQGKRNVLRLGKFVLPEKKLDINDLSNEIVVKALKKFKGNKSRAAGYLGISRQALYRRLDKIDKIS